MDGKKSFVVYSDYLQHVELLTMEQRGQLLTAMLTYAETGALPELDGVTAMAFSFIRAQMDRDREKWEQVRIQRSIAGQKGGLARAARRREELQREESCTFGSF